MAGSKKLILRKLINGVQGHRRDHLREKKRNSIAGEELSEASAIEGQEGGLEVDPDEIVCP